MQTDDRQVHQFLAQFTLLPMAEIEAVVTAHLAEPGRREGQRRLAREATSLVHGPAQAAAAEEASAILFGAPVADASIEALDAVAREVPVLDATADDLAAGLDLVDLLARPGSLAASKGEARRAVDQGGVYVNGARADGNRQVNAEDTLHGRYVVLRRGKKSVALLRTAVSSSSSST